MKRAELEEILKTTLKGIHFQGSDWTFERVVDAMVVVYNKGVENTAEAVRLEQASNYGRYIDDPNPEFKILQEVVKVIHTYGHGDSSYIAVRVSKNSLGLKIKD